MFVCVVITVNGAVPNCALLPLAAGILSLLGEGSDALSVCEAFCDRSAWKVLADELQLPARGLDLVIHVGNEVNRGILRTLLRVDCRRRACYSVVCPDTLLLQGYCNTRLTPNISHVQQITI